MKNMQVRFDGQVMYNLNAGLSQFSPLRADSCQQISIDPVDLNWIRLMQHLNASCHIIWLPDIIATNTGATPLHACIFISQSNK